MLTYQNIKYWKVPGVNGIVTDLLKDAREFCKVIYTMYTLKKGTLKLQCQYSNFIL